METTQLFTMGSGLLENGRQRLIYVIGDLLCAKKSFLSETRAYLKATLSKKLKE